MAMLNAGMNLENYEYTDKNGHIAIIPAGFSLTLTKGEDTIEEGLVIIDKDGNEFVWVPVNKEKFEEEFIIRAGYSDNKIQNISSYGEADGTGINTNTKIKEADSTKNEAIEMYSSVATHGGFYIGRYEAGKETISLQDGETKTKVVVKKEADLYNYVKWGDSTAEPINGAVELARNFATEHNYDTNQVRSTLCYSVQWDTALKFIDPSYTGYVKDSTKQGWFSDNYNSTESGNIDTNPNHITGKDLIYTETPTKISNMHKNIYDMGGNAREWVMEGWNSAGSRVVRGGNYKYAGSERSASNRTYGNLSDSLEYIGFRVALYIK